MKRIDLACLIRAWVFIVMLAGACYAGAGAVAAKQVAGGAAKTVWSGVYTAAQAERGKVSFNKNGNIPQSACSECHSADLTGKNGPALKDEPFMQSWGEDNLHSLFSLIKTDMPRNARGTWTEAEYIDIVAYILQANDFPAGTEELAPNPDVLKNTLIIRKEGPGPIPDFSLIKAVGCLSQGPNQTWVLTKSNLLRTRDGRVSQGAELKEAEARPLGMQTLVLSQVFPEPSSAVGQKIEVKGFLTRVRKEERVSLNSWQTVASTCEK